jgi:predicted RNase H-like HicB family nuclease
MRTYRAVVERDPESGWYVASVAGLPGCHTQAPTLEELDQNLQEVISLYLEGTEDVDPIREFVGVREVLV